MLPVRKNRASATTASLPRDNPHSSLHNARHRGGQGAISLGQSAAAKLLALQRVAAGNSNVEKSLAALKRLGAAHTGENKSLSTELGLKKTDLTEAVKYYRRAADDHFDKDAQFFMARRLAKGEGVEQADAAAAARYYELAAKQGRGKLLQLGRRERRFRVYEEAPGFRPGPHVMTHEQACARGPRPDVHHKSPPPPQPSVRYNHSYVRSTLKLEGSWGK
jgi:hypothetical protein